MFDRASTLAELLDSAVGRDVFEVFLPGVAASPFAATFRDVRLGQLSAIQSAFHDPAVEEAFFAALTALDDGGAPRAPRPPAIDPDPDFEGSEVARASARVTVPRPVPRFDVVEVRFDGPAHGNPFVDVDLTAEVSCGDRTFRIGGFYDGDGVYRVRFLAEAEGEWRLRTRSTARSLDGLEARGEVIGARDGRHGPVRVDGFHFRHEDGTRFRPLGTTAYAWTHQPEALQERTLAALADAPFRKIRMCLFPKSYLYNSGEPGRFPFPGSLAEGFDLERFDVAWWRAFEHRVAQLGDLGIEADLILFHAYDRWGFADLGPAVDERFLRYAVRRLAAHANVWWSMANEYDLLWGKTTADWERLAVVVTEEDPHGHLNSIHNCMRFFDYDRPWITHVSNQRIDVYRTAENVDAWRAQWGKPVVVDECAYEGDIDQGWGNITGEELTRRFWEGAVRGGYIGHGETYLNDREELWWSKGGELVGDSPDRIAFLDRILAEAPGGAIDPLPSDWDVPWGGVADRYLIAYFGFNRPRFRQVTLPAGAWRIDVVDTWGMTVEPLPGVHTGAVRVALPGRQFIAIRAVAVEVPPSVEASGSDGGDD